MFDSAKPLSIPIAGAYFEDEILIWSISLTGVAPLERGRDYEIAHAEGFHNQAGEAEKKLSEKSNIIHINLKPEYLAGVKTGDTLNVEVAIADGTEQFALARMNERSTKITELLESLTGELNKPESDPTTIGKTVTDLLTFYVRTTTTSASCIT